MSVAEEKAVVLTGNEGQSSDGLMHIISYQRRDRIQRAVTAWLGFWLLAVLSVPIIIAQWILVPAFLIAGPLVAFRRFKSESKAEKITGECPVCQKQVSIDLEADDAVPMWKYCSECKSSLNITEKPADC